MVDDGPRDTLPSSLSGSGLPRIIMGVVATLLVWALLAKIDTNRRGQGSVIPLSQRQVVSYLEGRNIEGIFVRKGEEVEADAPLLTLKQPETAYSLTNNLAGANKLRARVVRLGDEVLLIREKRSVLYDLLRPINRVSQRAFRE